MPKLLTVMCALASMGAREENEVSTETNRIDRAVNANVCDGWYHDVTGEYIADGYDFDVIGYDESVGRAQFGRRPHGGMMRAPQHGGMQRGPQRGGQHPAFPNQAGRFGGPGYGPAMFLPPGTPNPGWMKSFGGVAAPDEGLVPVPLTNVSNNGVFSATVTNLLFVARPQAPFRGERVVATLVRDGTSAAAVSADAINGISVGVAPQIADYGNISLEEWAKDAFGVRMAMRDTGMGGLIQANIALVGTLTTTDTLTVRLTVYGRWVQ